MEHFTYELLGGKPSVHGRGGLIYGLSDFISGARKFEVTEMLREYKKINLSDLYGHKGNRQACIFQFTELVEASRLQCLN